MDIESAEICMIKELQNDIKCFQLQRLDFSEKYFISVV